LLWIVDDNFLIDLDRAVGIGEGLVRRGVKFDWSIQASTNLVSRLSVEELKLLKRAGLAQISQGADTGSPRVMKLMNKDFQDLDMIYLAAEKLTAANIRPSFNLIFGYPGETEHDRRQSIALMMNICRKYPGAEFWTNIFTPYPGSPIMKRAFELGIDVPKTLAGWADFFPRYTVLPWLKGREHERVQNMREYMRVAFHRVPIGKYRVPALNRLVFELISGPARWRLDHHVYSFPVDLWVKKVVQNVIAPPKPKVDAHQLSAEPVTC
jgi:radical SAM superfamily enzyme YgiQ (UPF0313 family)